VGEKYASVAADAERNAPDVTLTLSYEIANLSRASH